MWSAAKIALALGLIAYIASRTDLGEIAALRQRLSVPWLAASVMIFAMLNGVRAYQYYLLIGRRAEFGRVLNLVILQNTLSNFVASSAGALAYVAMLSAGEGVTVRRAAASFVIAKLGDLVAVGALLAVSAALVWARIAALHGLVMLLLASVVAITGVILLAALMHGALIGTIERWLGRLGVHEHPASARMLQMLRSVTEEAPG
ncbi:MAG TPA: lysylphosphatidylglycerol synthase domain-containing protein, partial [Usitatibacter sp.]|nr:lysylphosphatidylglycerol synthase domain-containing protein [Usitatibacter sp.]